jgi:hypothetical protein
MIGFKSAALCFTHLLVHAEMQSRRGHLRIQSPIFQGFRSSEQVAQTEPTLFFQRGRGRPMSSAEECSDEMVGIQERHFAG